MNNAPNYNYTIYAKPELSAQAWTGYQTHLEKKTPYIQANKVETRIDLLRNWNESSIGKIYPKPIK